MKMLSFLGGCACDKIVKYVEVAFARRNSSDSVSFKIVIEGLYAAQATSLGELQFSVLAKPRSVRIKEGACVSKRFDDELCGGDLVCEFCTFLSGIRDGEFEEGFDGKTSVLRLSACGFATEKNGLVLCCAPHVVISIVGELEYVGGQTRFSRRGVPILCGILVEDGVSV